MEKINFQLIRNSKGVTLVELLASLVLLSLVVTLAMSVFMLGQNAFERQTTKADMQDAVTLAMKSITKDIRSTPGDEIDITEKDESPPSIIESAKCGNTMMDSEMEFITGDKITFNPDESSDGFAYFLEDNQLQKGERVITDHIQSIVFTKSLSTVIEEVPAETAGSESCSLIAIEITSTDPEISLKSEIYIRE